METENPENSHQKDNVSSTEVNTNEIFSEEETTAIETNPKEIHTHPHIYQPKKWNEYVFQFIMLFLAITLGFFVENERENYNEQQRAKVLAASLVQNLKADLDEIETVIKTSDTIIMSNTILIEEFNKPRELQNDSIIHRNGLQKIMRFNVFDPNSGNYDQVKYSGALRYFKPEIVNQLTSYETNRNYLFKMSKLYLDFNSSNLVPFCLENSNPKFADAILNNKTIPNPIFTKEPTPEFLDQIYNYALNVNRLNNQQIKIVKMHKKRAEKLIQILTKTYDLDENQINIDD